MGTLVVLITASLPRGHVIGLGFIEWQGVAFVWLMGVKLIDMPSLYELLAAKIPTDHIADAWLLIHSLNSTKVYYRHSKRITDLVLAAVGLALTWPRWVLIAAAIKLDSPGPVFFRQERLGQDGKPFPILKFRTMIENAESNGPQFASRRDPRVNRVGPGPAFL